MVVVDVVLVVVVDVVVVVELTVVEVDAGIVEDVDTPAVGVEESAEHAEVARTRRPRRTRDLMPSSVSAWSPYSETRHRFVTSARPASNGSVDRGDGAPVLDGLQSLLEVEQQVIRVLDTHRQAHE